jgi:hypothetical protein
MNCTPEFLIREKILLAAYLAIGVGLFSGLGESAAFLFSWNKNQAEAYSKANYGSGNTIVEIISIKARQCRGRDSRSFMLFRTLVQHL